MYMILKGKDKSYRVEHQCGCNSPCSDCMAIFKGWSHTASKRKLVSLFKARQNVSRRIEDLEGAESAAVPAPNGGPPITAATHDGHESPAGLELLEQLARLPLDGALDDDGVKGPLLRRAAHEVPRDEGYVARSGVREIAGRSRRELGIT